MNDFLGADGEPNIAVALLIRRDAKSMLNSDVSLVHAKANASCSDSIALLTTESLQTISPIQ